MSRDLLLLCFLCIAVRLPWIFTTPASEAPDEYTHLWVITFLRDHLRLPGGQEVLSAGPTAVYGSLPPLGYIPHAFITRFVPDSEIALFARYGSLLAGLVTVWAAWRIGQELFAASRLLSLALPLLVVFHPQLVFVHTYANNDSTASAAGTITIYLLMRALKHGLTVRRSLGIGLAISFLALCKYSGWSLIPVTFLTIVAAAYLHGGGWLLAARSLLIVAAIFSSTAGLWLVRNYHEFSGDWMGTKTMYHTWAVAFNKRLVYQIPPWQVILDKRWWRFLLFSFWGMFGYTSRYIWRPLYYVFLGFMIASGAGWIKAITARIRAGALNLQARLAGGSRAELVGPAVWSMLALACLFNLAGMVFASTVNLGGPQGRYLFVSEIPVMAILLSGLNRLGRRAARYTVVALIGFTALTCIGSWAMLFHLFGFRVHP